MRSNAGVTMVELLVVIIIIVMIATFAISSGTDTLDEADVTEVFVEITAVKSALTTVTVKKDINPDLQIVQGDYYDDPFSPAEGVSYGDNVLGYQEDWHIIYGVDEAEKYAASRVRDNMGLETLNHTYIVNYKTSDVELYRPVTVKDLKVRTYDEIRELAK